MPITRLALALAAALLALPAGASDLHVQSPQQITNQPPAGPALGPWTCQAEGNRAFSQPPPAPMPVYVERTRTTRAAAEAAALSACKTSRNPPTQPGSCEIKKCWLAH